MEVCVGLKHKIQVKYITFCGYNIIFFTTLRGMDTLVRDCISLQTQAPHNLKQQFATEVVLLRKNTFRLPVLLLSPVLFFQALNGLSEESSTEHLEFPLLIQSSLSSIPQLLPFLRTLCCSFQAPPNCSQPPAHLRIAEYPAASSHSVLSRLERIIENEFLDSMES